MGMRTHVLYLKSKIHASPHKRRVEKIRSLHASLRSQLHSQTTRGRGHDGLVNCVRTGMSKGLSFSKTFVAANAIYSHKFASHDALVSAFVATYEYSPAIFSVVGIFRNR